MKFGVVVFPGSNCDRDMIEALREDLVQEARLQADLRGPGGHEPRGRVVGQQLRREGVEDLPVQERVRHPAQIQDPVVGHRLIRRDGLQDGPGGRCPRIHEAVGLLCR